MNTNKQNSITDADDIARTGHGRQGTDKVPGEETPQDTDQTVEVTQKGKSKVDGDPSKRSDQPLNRE